ncbi:MAG: chitinase [Frankiaceae bacterium]|nr:chitinase [Frankiaceae bacterium]
MRSRSRRIAVMCVAVTTAALTVSVPASADPGHSAYVHSDSSVVSAYFADWDVYGRGYEVADIPADNLNTILYAFGKPVIDPTSGAVTCGAVDPWADYERTPTKDINPSMTTPKLSGNFSQLLKLKAQQAAKGKSLKVLISIGGWSLSNGFSQAAASPASRAAFVSSCLDTFIKGNLAPDWITGDGIGAAAGLFDGIDVDWEYPTAVGAGNVHTDADRHNATLLFTEFRNQLDALGQAANKHYLLTAALPAAENSNKYYELADVTRILDYANVMTYDFHGSWDPKADFDSPFNFDPATPNPGVTPAWSTTGTVDYYLAQGVSPDKINIGVPYYAKQFIRTGTANAGLYQSFDNTGLDANSLQWDQTPTPTFHDLVDNAKLLTNDGALTASASGWTTNWNHVAREPWLYGAAATHALGSGAVTAPTFITYEDPKSVADRVRYVRKLGLRGAFAWEISQDSAAGGLSSQLAQLLQH